MISRKIKLKIKLVHQSFASTWNTPYGGKQQFIQGWKNGNA
jgi:hypothetical protein